jgi:predicted ATPase/serine/threonine protein kinase
MLGQVAWGNGRRNGASDIRNALRESLLFLIRAAGARHSPGGGKCAEKRLTTQGPGLPGQNQPMTLSSGTQFGRYEIVCPLGAGGMGEVYRARDPHLGRELAIKILSQKLSASEQALDRFEQEARTVSKLNHPNIVTIFELARVDQTYYMAMELVEGEALSELLRGGPLPLRKAISIATQAAGGLAKAHEAGVVHRDLKPGNLMITRDGLLKILDFGLAKLVNPASGPAPQGETLSGPLTVPGAIMGTLAYMSPEQASGVPVDFRSDQFSFGAVLYEMVTGKRPFQRVSDGATLVAIVRDDPESALTLNPRAPAPLCWVIERCLAKNPGDRYGATQDLARDLAAIHERLDEAPSRHAAPRPQNLPLPRTVFIGREREVAAVKELLLRSDVRVITLTGPGGIGKTRLALKAAGEVGQSFPGGVCFVPLAAVNDAAMIPSVIAQALGMRETGVQVTMETLKEYLPEVRDNLLLLFDNFEHLLAAAPKAAELLAAAPTLKMLVTSRSPLHIYGEYEFPVPSLPLPDLRGPLSPAELSRNPTIALFVDRATAVKPNFAITEENAAAVAALCARLEGLPLAIELAAARIKLLSPAAMQARLEKRLELLTGGARDLPERQRTLRGTIDWSYGLLNPAEQALFRRVSVFAGGCTLEGVEAVCDTRQDLGVDVLEGMASLVDKSLVQQVESSGSEFRFVMLDTVREYGVECLAASGEEPETRRAHAAYCLVVAEECAAPDADPATPECVNLLEAEHDNCRAALEWLTRTRDAEWGLRLGTALFRFWETREYLAEGRESLGKLLKIPGAAGPTKARERVLFAAGVLASDQGDYAAAVSLMRESLDIAVRLGDKQGAAVSLNGMAVLARDQGDVAGARSLMEESLGLWRELGDQKAVARALSNLATVVKLQGDLPRSRALHEECMSIFGSLGDRTGVAWSLDHQGDVVRDQGDYAAARALYEQGLALFRELGDRWGIAGTLADLGNLAREQGDFAAADSLYRQSLKMFRELEHKRGIARLLECFACSAAEQRQAERSLRLAGAAAALRQNIGAPLTPAERAKLEPVLDSARQALSTSGAAAWLGGWTTRAENAMEEVLSADAGAS